MGRPSLVLLAALLAGILVPGKGSAAAQGAPAKPAPAESGKEASKDRWTEVRRDTLRRYASAVGGFQARRTTQVGPGVSGRVLKVLVDVGDTVKAGQELVQLEPALFEIEVAQRRADLESAQVGLAEAELNHTRMKNLWEKPDGGEPSIPRKLYDDARSRREGALSRVTQSKAALDWALERLKETVVRAPYDAAVTRRMVDPGEPVTATPVAHLLELQEVGVLVLEYSLPQEMLSRVKEGAPVEFEAEGASGGKGEARIDVVYPVVDPATRSFRCRTLVENGERRFRPGMLASVRILEREVKEALLVPRAALRQTASGWQVQVLSGDTQAARPVKVGLMTDDLAEILEGLKPGEKVAAP